MHGGLPSCSTVYGFHSSRRSRGKHTVGKHATCSICKFESLGEKGVKVEELVETMGAQAFCMLSGLDAVVL